MDLVLRALDEQISREQRRFALDCRVGDSAMLLEFLPRERAGWSWSSASTAK